MRTTPTHDRRGCPRRAASACPWLTSARLRTGLDVAIIDLAAGGALVEAASRLLPGSNVELHLGAPEWRWSTPARVLRCRVSALVVERGVLYRAALRFDRDLEPPCGEDTWKPPRGIPSSSVDREGEVAAMGSYYPGAPLQGAEGVAATQAAGMSLRRSPLRLRRG